MLTEKEENNGKRGRETRFQIKAVDRGGRICIKNLMKTLVVNSIKFGQRAMVSEGVDLAAIKQV